MNRVIKFRVWYKYDNPPLKFEQANNGGHTMRFEHYVYDDIHPLTYDFQVPFLDDDWIIEQFTGLKDKNGKEIYEGDIVEYFADELAEIKFMYGGWVVAMKMGYDRFDSLCGRMEVIGNIHENEGLLKQSSQEGCTDEK